MDSFECCQWGDFEIRTEDGELIFPQLCDCDCHLAEGCDD